MARTTMGPPPSLVHLFEPPEGFVGRFGWLCGYSADAAFLERATERFTHLSAPRRGFSGTIALALMLDPGQPQITPVDVPGLLHLPMRHPAQREFALLHAKVALLSFRHERDPENWCLRLIVSTGNWTRQTLDESLDLAWHVDLGRATLQERTEAVRQAQADLHAAAHFINYVRGFFDTSIFVQEAPEGAVGGPQDWDRWVKEAIAGANSRRARFFDSRRASLLAQLRTQIGRVSIDEVARNYLAMGSGFFEGADGMGGGPTVPERIVQELRGTGDKSALLTKAPEVNLFLNPLACQGMAVFARNLPHRWSLHRPYRQDSSPWRKRALHAKFLFSANWRQDAEYCSSAWLYLGSGNLTHPGFTHAAHRDRGNLEAGVVLGVKDARWSELAEFLPVDELTGESFVAVEQLVEGEEMPERPEVFTAPPVAFFILEQDESGSWLRASGPSNVPFDVLSISGALCVYEPERGFAWSGAPPRQVRVRWSDSGKTREAEVPVVDAFGRVAGLLLQKLDLGDAWAQLADFPLPPPDEDLEDVDAADPSIEQGPAAPATSTAPPSRYATRELMTLVENIAALQEALNPADWRTWCRRLEQTLTLASESDGARLCQTFGMNLLSPLHHPEFRPAFAENASTQEGQMYDEALRRVELAWGVSELPALGEAAE